MKVKMLKSTQGSKDGIHVEHFKEGTEYDFPDSLAKCFIDGKFAVEAKAEAGEPDKKEQVKQPEVKEEKPEVKDEKKSDESESDTISKKR